MSQHTPRIHLLAVPCLVLALSACKGGDVDTDDTAPAVGDVSYYADVKPIVDIHCTRCHSDGGLGPADFTDASTVEAMAEIMLAQIDAGTMPPPASDPECQDYEGSDALVLDAREKSIVRAWIDQDKPMGDPADDPQVQSPSGELEDPDLVLTMDAPYTPTWWDQDNPGNEYRCFVLDPGHDDTLYINAMAPVVDQAALVHHVVLFTTDRDGIGDQHTGPEGFDCIDGDGGLSTDEMVSAWAPGMLPVQFPEGYGMALSAEKVLVVQMHYFQNGNASGADQSGYAFKLLDEIDRQMFLAPTGIFDFRIPAGDDSYQAGDTFDNSFLDLELFGVFPHMHVLGERFDAKINHEDGSESCVVRGTYDFDNQMTYQFTEPVDFNVGDSLDFTCTWNNSESNPELDGRSPQDTYYGERTDEEMCFFFAFVAAG